MCAYQTVKRCNRSVSSRDWETEEAEVRSYRTNIDLLVKNIETFQKCAVVIESEVLCEASAEDN